MLATLLSVAICGIFAAWFLATIANQFSLSQRPGRLGTLLWKLKRADIFSLIPIWTFFAPNPGTRDHDVFYRDRLVDGTLTPWHSLCDNRVPWSSIVWNPRKRLKKAVLDMSLALTRQAVQTVQAKRDLRRVLVSIPYIGLALRVSSIPRGPLTEVTQFMVSVSHGYQTDREPEVLFISQFFRVQ